MPAVYEDEIAPSLRASQTLLFAHGFAIHYRAIIPRKGVDVVMVAPKGLGPMVRREFVRGRGVPGLIAIHQNPSRHAKRTALAWAKGIGCTRAGVMETSFREETETDLFGEQAVLCGGTSALTRAGFETLVRAGYPPELAYFECLHEFKFIVDIIHEAGISGMRARISETAKWRINRGSENYRCFGAQTNGRRTAKNSLRQVRARIRPRDRDWPKALPKLTSRSR